MGVDLWLKKSLLHWQPLMTNTLPWHLASHFRLTVSVLAKQVKQENTQLIALTDITDHSSDGPQRDVKREDEQKRERAF